MPSAPLFVLLAPQLAALSQPVVCQPEAISASPLVPLAAVEFGGFGTSLATDDRVVLVGQPMGLSPAGQQTGSVQVFNAATRIQVGELHADPPIERGHFGAAIAVYGDKALVGAPGYDNFVDPRPSNTVHVFDIDTGTQLARFERDGVHEDGAFGWDVAISDRYAATGGSEYVYPDGFQPGAVHVFDLADGQRLHRLTSPGSEAADAFGVSLALWGTTLAVGAPRADEVGDSGGAVYFFDIETGALLRTLVAPDQEAGDRFGSAIATTDQALIVSSAGDDDAAPDAGAVYTFDRSTLALMSKWTPPGDAEQERLGVVLSAHGTTVAVGNITANALRGAAYVFDYQFPARGVRLGAVYADPSPLNPGFGRAVAVSSSTVFVGTHEARVAGLPYGNGAFAFDQPLLDVCRRIDLVAPCDRVTIQDASAFASPFAAVHGFADLVAPAGVIDLSDVDAFVAAYNAGCP